MLPTIISIYNPHNDSNSFFFSKNILTVIGVSPKYYPIHNNRVEVGIIYHLQQFLGQERSKCSNCKTCCTHFWNNHIYIGFPRAVLFRVIPRNLLLQILAIFLCSWVIYESFQELLLVINCMKRVLSIFSVNILVLNQLFMSWKILITLF